MAKSLEAHSGDRIFLLAAVVAACAAIFMVAIWAPLQVQAFRNAAGAESTVSSPAAADIGAWARVPFATVDGDTTSLQELNGRVRVVTMLYTHCPGVCPFAVSNLQSLEKKLNTGQRARLSVIALSLDPQRDSIQQLKAFRYARGIDSGWVLGRPTMEGARQLAAGLGVSYRVLDDDSVDHQSVFVLLARDGRVLARSGSQNPDPRFVEALGRALAGG